MASASYSSKKSASESSLFPEKNGALFERGPGIAATPEIDMMVRTTGVGEGGGAGGMAGGSESANMNELGNRVESEGGCERYEVEWERFLW